MREIPIFRHIKKFGVKGAILNSNHRDSLVNVIVVDRCGDKVFGLNEYYFIYLNL